MPGALRPFLRMPTRPLHEKSLPAPHDAAPRAPPRPPSPKPGSKTLCGGPVCYGIAVSPLSQNPLRAPASSALAWGNPWAATRKPQPRLTARTPSPPYRQAECQALCVSLYLPSFKDSLLLITRQSYSFFILHQTMRFTLATADYARKLHRKKSLHEYGINLVTSPCNFHLD